MLNNNYLKTWLSMLDIDIEKSFAVIQEKELESHSVTFYTSVSVMSSSKIEGEQMEIDSYVKHKLLNIEYLSELTEKPNDLYDAYQFAKVSALNESNIYEVHKMLTKHFLPENRQGKIRNGSMYVTTDDGRIEYVAVSPYGVKIELEKFYTDLNALINMDLTVQEVFYFASLLHLVFVKIHPFDDGNGRTSRLIEKWFLAQKLGEKAWLIQSEKNYYLQHQTYYKNIRRLGLEYETLDYEKSLPFLLMLPQSLLL